MLKNISTLFSKTAFYSKILKINFYEGRCGI
jgi:hypothetical protein